MVRITVWKASAALLASLLTAGCGLAQVDFDDPYGTMGPRGEGYFARRMRDDAPPRLKPLELPSGPMTIDEVIAIALRYGPQSRQSREGIAQSLASLGMNQGAYLPQISGALGLQKSKSLSYNETSHADDVYSKRYDIRVSAQWSLLNFVRPHSIEGARAAVRSAVAQHDLQLLDIAVTAEVYYYRLLEAEWLLDVVKETVALRERYVEFARRRAVALAGKSELPQAEADLAEAEITLVEAESQLRLFRGRLASVMGFQPNAPIEIVGLGDELPEHDLPDVADLFKQAAANRPRLKALAAEVRRGEEQLAIQHASRLPDLSAAASYGVAAPHFMPDAGANEWTAGLNVSMELFTGFQRTYAIMQVKHQLRATRAAYEAALRSVEQEVHQAHSEVDRAHKAIRATEKFVDSAKTNLEQTSREFENGTADIVRLNEAQTSYTRSRYALVRARLDYRVALAQLNRALGRGLERVPSELRD